MAAIRNALARMRALCLILALVFALLEFDFVRADQPSPRRDINAVLRDHDKQLLAIPNVVGVYVGVMEKTNKPCLKVMLRREPLTTDPEIPRSIEGYLVVTEVSGDVRPLKTP